MTGVPRTLGQDEFLTASFSALDSGDYHTHELLGFLVWKRSDPGSKIPDEGFELRLE